MFLLYCSALLEPILNSKRTNLRASSAPCGRGSKPQKFSFPFLFSSAGGVGGADKKWKGNFWFCFATSDYKMNISIISFVVLWSCSFLRPCGETRRFLSAFSGSSKPLWLRSLVVVTHKADCARHKQICMCLTHPPVRAQIPAVFRRYYKTAGIAPYKPQESSFSNL